MILMGNPIFAGSNGEADIKNDSRTGITWRGWI